jgi:Kef-type K+ transport system membrane component KefB
MFSGFSGFPGASSPPAADSVAHVALLLALVLTAAKLGGEAAVRLKQSPVLGELLAGMLLGNLPWFPLREVGAEPSVELLAGLGVLILLFQVGLESTVRDVAEVGAGAVRVALLGTFGSFLAGFALVSWILPDSTATSRIFVAASITATSIGITARVFKDLGQSRSKEARTILGAAVVDDIIGLVVLALVTGWVKSHIAGGPSVTASLFWILVKTTGFLVVAIFVGGRIAPRLFATAARLRAPGAQLAVGLAFCFLLAWAADAMGLAPLVGAFSAGLVLEDHHSAKFVARGERSLAQLIEPLSEFLVPIFFVVMGLRADMRVLVQPATLLLVVGLTLAAILGKLSCGLGAARGVNRLTVAVGMMPRGEVTLIFASLGLTLASGGLSVLDRSGYSALVSVVILTTILTPPSLKKSFALANRQSHRDSRPVVGG